MTDSKKVYDYLRARISGTLRLESLLHCGNGDLLPVSVWESAKVKGDKGHINTVCKAQDGKPYIPASTIRGSLRERCNATVRDNLFGTARGDEGVAGKVRVYDATHCSTPVDKGDLYRHQQFQTSLHDGVTIDPVTGTAQERLLFCHEVVPRGSIFQLELEADRVTEDELQTLLDLLRGWDGGMQTSIGKGRSKGWGKLRWGGTTTVETLTDESIRQWVRDDSAVAPKWDKKTIDSFQTARSKKRIVFTLYPAAPILVNDHGRVSSGDGKPQLEYMRTLAGKAVIPGSSLRGVVRAHAHRILATIAHQHYELPIADANSATQPLIEALFGKERSRSPFWIDDAIAETTEPHHQFFNAVDRFTGGVAESALYNVVAAQCPSLQGECMLETHPERLPKGDWWKGLLLLVLRDFMEGDFTVGWGRGRGYGAGQVSIHLSDGTECSGFSDLLVRLTDFNPQKWIVALHKKVEQESAEQGSEPV